MTDNKPNFDIDEVRPMSISARLPLPPLRESAIAWPDPPWSYRGIVGPCRCWLTFIACLPADTCVAHCCL